METCQRIQLEGKVRTRSEGLGRSLDFILNTVKSHRKFSEESESVSRSVVSDSFATPWTVACQVPVHGISQARILEWAVISYSRGSP